MTASYFSKARMLPLVLLGLALMAAAACQTPAGQPAGEFTFTILQLNDVYEIAPLEGGKAGGLARVATLRKRLLKEDPNTLTILPGDFLSPSVLGTLKDSDGERIRGRHMIEVLNALGVDVATFGNHEFDYDREDLQKRLDESTFDWVSANVFERHPDGSLAPFARTGGQPFGAWQVIELTRPDGRLFKLGVVGVTLPFNKRDYVAYTDVYDAFKAAYEEARAAADLVIGVTHLSLPEDKELAARVPGLRLILGGHEHTHSFTRVGETMIAKADANAKTVYVHQLTWHEDAEALSVVSVLTPITDTIASDPEVDAIVQRWNDVADQAVRNLGYDPEAVIASVEEPLEGREQYLRHQPTNLGTLIAEGMRLADPTADAALLNSGSIRIDDAVIGEITAFDILRILPYGGRVVRTALPGTVLRRTLEVGTTNMGMGGFLQMSGVKAADGGFSVGGEPLDDSRSYRVLMPEFLASGRESGLEFLGDHSFEELEQDDLRELFIARLQQGE